MRLKMWLCRPGLLVTLLVALASCSELPPRPQTERVVALPRAADGPLSDFYAEIENRLDSDESAYWLIEQSKEALDTRLALFDSASSSLDVQYFIWEPDPSGRLLLRRLLHAADRGVRVRLLMDDISVTGRDREYRALDSHPMIEVRLFNPWRHRSRIARVVEYFARFPILNHRLHNKTVIADRHLALIGGRNIGDRYFGLYDDFVQNDLDILFAGPMADRVTEDFDRYWNAAESYSVAAYLRREPKLTIAELEEYLDSVVDANRAHLSAFALEPADWTAWQAELLGTLAPGTGEYYYDWPQVSEARPNQLTKQLIEFISSAEKELIMSTAYLVPDRELVDELAALADRGVRVRLLTNSLQTNNHTIAHVAYKRWRRELLEAGAELYELRPDAHILDDYAVAPAEPGFLGLHSKAVIVDGRWSFVGTPNIDPRSLEINTENGVVVDSEMLAGELGALLSEAMLPVNSWRVRLDDAGKLRWYGNPSEHRRQPANGLGQRMLEFFVNLLPLKKQA
jgi:putative cardiolipin synthase